jgi:hypothetical protein
LIEDIEAGDADVAAGGSDETRDHLDGGLPGAVHAEQRQNPTGLSGKYHVTIARGQSRAYTAGAYGVTWHTVIS